MAKRRRRAFPIVAKVPCVRCRAHIPANSIRCPECGVHFSGKAFQFAKFPYLNGRWYRAGNGGAFLLFAGIVLIAFLIALMG